MKRLIIALLVLWCGAVYAAEPADSVTVVRSLLNEASASFWSDAELQEFLDQGVYDIAAKARCIQGSDTFLLVTSQYEYTTFVASSSTTISYVRGCIYISPDNEYIGLKRIYPSQISDLPHMLAGPPKYFYHVNSIIGIFPLPTASENGESVKIYYASKPTGATLALRIAELPAEFMSPLYWYAASMAYKKEHRYAESDKFYQMYQQELTALKQELYSAPPEQPTK